MVKYLFSYVYVLLSKLLNRCPTCGTIPFPHNTTTSTTATPTTSSTVFVGGGGGAGAGGECSTTASPRRVDHAMILTGSSSNNNNVGEPTTTATSTSSTHICSDGFGGTDVDIPLAFYMYRGLTSSGLNHPSTMVAGGGMKVAGQSQLQQQQQQGTYMQEARASNQNTPVGSPLHRNN